MPVKPNVSPAMGSRLRAWRTTKGYTQSDAARELGMSFRAYQDIERGYSESTGYGRTCLLKMLAEFERTQNPPAPENPTE